MIIPLVLAPVDTRPAQAHNRSFMLGYSTGSQLLMMLFFILVVPALAMIPLSRSRSRRDLEAEVIDAIKDTWPEAASYSGPMRGR